MAQSKSQKALKKAMSKKPLTGKEQARKSAPRNPIVRAMVEQKLFQSTSHKDKKKASVRGSSKHKVRNYGA